MTNIDDTVKIIRAIGEQWPFLLLLFSITVIVIKWKTIWNTFSQFKKFKIKRGSSELEVMKDNFLEKGHEPLMQKTKQAEEDETKDDAEEVPNTLFDTYLKLRDGKIDEANILFENLQRDAKGSKKIENGFIYLFYKFLNGIPNTENEFLKAINEPELNNLQKAIGYKYLGLSYKNINQYSKAIKALREAITLTSDEALQNELTIYISNCYKEDNEIDKAFSELFSGLKSSKSDKLSSNLYVELAGLYEKKGNMVFKAIALEKALNLRGNDTSIMFDLAYCYSETEFEDASIFHYLNLLKIKPNNSTALNNIGVGYKNKGLPFKSVNYYKQAVEHDESLAAANLATLYVESGFEEEANLLFNKFISKPEVHKNLISIHSTLSHKKETEDNDNKSIKESGFILSKYFNTYATAYFEGSKINNLKDENWTDDEQHKISVEIEAEKLSISWRKKNEKLKDDDIYEINGILNNQACEIIYKVPETKTPGIFSLDIFSNNNDPSQPYRDFINYNGFCYIDIENGRIEILFIQNKKFVFKIIEKISV